MIGDPFLNYFALGLLFLVVFALFYGIIAIHDIPHLIAKSRDHPHQDAIHAAGWVSLFMQHALWPFVWIWAMAYRPDRGCGVSLYRALASRLSCAGFPCECEVGRTTSSWKAIEWDSRTRRENRTFSFSLHQTEE
jgi:uncharacterized protein DUF3302